MACLGQFEEIVADINEELQTILHHSTKSFKIVLNVILRQELHVFLLYLPTCDKKMNKYAYTVMINTDPICPILGDPINPFLCTFLCQTSVVLIMGSMKTVMAITYSKKLKLNIES